MFVEKSGEIGDAGGGIYFFGSQHIVALEDVEEKSGVEIAGAGAHDDAACGSEAHGGVDGLGVVDSGDAGAVAEVGDDQAWRDIFVERVEDRFAGEAVEAIAADAGLPEIFGDGETRSGFRESAVEGSVEAGELTCLRKKFLGFADEFEGDWDVEWCEVGGCFEFGQDLRRDFLVGGEIGAAVDYAVADGFRCREIVGAELAGYQLEGVGLIVDRVGLFVQCFAIGGLELDFSAIGIDAVGGASCELADIAGIGGLGEESELQRGGAAVEDENRICGHS